MFKPPLPLRPKSMRNTIVSTPRNLPRQQAYSAGIWAAASLGIAWAMERANDMFQAIHTEGTDYQGGYLMNDELSDALIVVRETYGIFRRYARVVPMKRAVMRVGRRSTGNTAYAVGEGAAGTETDLVLNGIQLNAKKFMALTRVTSEVDEDTITAFGDEVIGEIGYAFSVIEDKAGFIGDGTSTYAGIEGIITALAAGAITTCAAASTWATIADTDVSLWMGSATDVLRDPAIYCSRQFFEQTLMRLAKSTGFAVAMEVVNGKLMYFYNGYPVRFTTALPIATAVSTISAIFGDLSLGATLGDRRDVRIQRSDIATQNSVSVFETDEIAIKGTERIDIVINEIGTASVGGALVALKTHS